MHTDTACPRAIQFSPPKNALPTVRHYQGRPYNAPNKGIYKYRRVVEPYNSARQQQKQATKKDTWASAFTPDVPYHLVRLRHKTALTPWYTRTHETHGYIRKKAPCRGNLTRSKVQKCKNLILPLAVLAFIDKKSLLSRQNTAKTKKKTNEKKKKNGTRKKQNCCAIALAPLTQSAHRR